MLNLNFRKINDKKLVIKSLYIFLEAALYYNWVFAPFQPIKRMPLRSASGGKKKDLEVRHDVSYQL